MSRAGRALLGSLLLLPALGCLIWPAPTGDLLAGRGRIQRQYTAPLEVGKATLEDVVLRLGEPDEIQADGRVLLYRWTEMRGFLALIGMNASVVIPFPGPRKVRVCFGDDGKLTEVAFLGSEPEVGPL